tara:strand:+ start:473 stop:805 length:333 start_codon:yes stop_codon:yes gene_type:complete
VKKKMPTYSFRNTETGEEYDEFMKIKERTAFLENNPHIQAVPTAAGFIAGHDYNKKLDGGFKDTMSRIAEAHPTSEHAKKWGDKGSKEAKTRIAVDKWRNRRIARGETMT